MSRPQHLTEILVPNLPTAERLFLWAVRTWAAHHDDVSPIWWSLDRAFAQEDIHAALAPFDRMMSAVFSGLKRWPDIRCARCLNLGQQEAQLLSAFAHLQQNNEVGARLALQDWLIRSAARVVCESAQQCTRIASAAGLRFASNSVHLQQNAVACADQAQTADLH